MSYGETKESLFDQLYIFLKRKGSTISPFVLDRAISEVIMPFIEEKERASRGEDR